MLGSVPRPRMPQAPHRMLSQRGATGRGERERTAMSDATTDGTASGQTVPGIGFAVATVLLDTLYDRIPLSRPELALIGTRAFLRLDRIQQLGFVSRVWPGAKHTRYEHSLGVLHLTRLAIAHLRARPDGAWLTAEDARVAAAAALLHDIGHYPFSHAVEELGPPILPHEAVGRRLIEGPELAPLLREAWGVDPARVAAMVDPNGRALPPADRVLRGVLSGPLDMDKLDYLPRDARACNVPYGGVDTARLIDSLGIAGAGDGADAAARITVGAKGVSPLHSLINARQEMFDNVYWHHTNRACMAMLLRAVQDALEAGGLAPEELPRHDDASLLARLAEPAMPPSTRALVGGLRGRVLHRRALEISPRAGAISAWLDRLFFDPPRRKRAETALGQALAEAIGLEIASHEVLLDIPKPERWEVDIWVYSARPAVGLEPLMSWLDATGASAEQLARYEQHQRRVRVVVSPRLRELA